MEVVDIIEQNISDISPALLNILLKDKTTGLYLRWATDNYESYGAEYGAAQQIMPYLVTGENTDIIKPRVIKTESSQRKRTRDKAEVFTPLWICNQQNNLIDAEWFKKPEVFNTETVEGWVVNTDKIEFPKGKSWKKYVDARRLELSCGEAPYIASRYDTTTGKYIPVERRIGLLDRKLRVINENLDDESEWFKWAVRAFQSIYGYEFQGDNVLLARENLLYTLIENMRFKFNHDPDLLQLSKVATIIAWNIWQMDGLTMTVPFGDTNPIYRQITAYEYLSGTVDKGTPIFCRIFDWRAKHSLEFREIMGGTDK